MNRIMLNVVFLLLFFLAFGALVCTSYKCMLKKAKRLEAEGKEVPECMARRRRQIKKCYADWKAHPKTTYLICALFTIALFVVSYLIG